MIFPADMYSKRIKSITFVLCGVDERTIKRYIQEYGDELRANGYFLSQGKELKDIKMQIGKDINVPT